MFEEIVLNNVLIDNYFLRSLKRSHPLYVWIKKNKTFYIILDFSFARMRSWDLIYWRLKRSKQVKDASAQCAHAILSCLPCTVRIELDAWLVRMGADVHQPTAEFHFHEGEVVKQSIVYRRAKFKRGEDFLNWLPRRLFRFFLLVLTTLQPGHSIIGKLYRLKLDWSQNCLRGISPASVDCVYHFLRCREKFTSIFSQQHVAFFETSDRQVPGRWSMHFYQSNRKAIITRWPRYQE